MKKNQPFLLLPFFAILIFAVACTSSKTMRLNSIELTEQLRPGMKYDEVVAILGNPKSTQTVEDKWIARWNLQEMWKGYIPYDFVFDPTDQTLISWAENQKAYQQKQEQLQQVANTLEKSTESQNTGGNNAAASGPNDSQLMQQMAGSWYSFTAVGGGYTGGTERKLNLCANGRYYYASESGYSGDAGKPGAWGTASQGGNGGTWRISGNTNEGTIVLVSGNGKTSSYKFKSCGNGCIYLGNIKYAYAGKASCD